MQPFKRLHFEQEHGFAFPPVRPLTSAECRLVLDLLKTRLRLPRETSPLELVRELDRQQQVVSEIAADDPGFNLLAVLPGPLATTSLVYLNWHQFDEIDEVEVQSLATFFSDFWYPASDDIDIFDVDLAWILTIRHDGVIKQLRFVTAE